MDTWVNTNATQRNSMAEGRALEEFLVHAGVKNRPEQVQGLVLWKLTNQY